MRFSSPHKHNHNEHLLIPRQQPQPDSYCRLWLQHGCPRVCLHRPRPDGLAKEGRRHHVQKTGWQDGWQDRKVGAAAGIPELRGKCCIHKHVTRAVVGRATPFCVQEVSRTAGTCVYFSRRDRAPFRKSTVATCEQRAVDTRACSEELLVAKLTLEVR